MKRIETIILALLWLCAIATYPIALLNNYSLYTSDYVGLAGLFLVTIIGFFRPEKILTALLILLVVGTLNVASFIYFVNLVMAFGFGGLVTPGIQFLSLVLLGILFLKRRSQIMEFYRGTPSDIETEREQVRENLKSQYKKRFLKLTDKEIESQLKLNLVPEATEALREIVEERKCDTT